MSQPSCSFRRSLRCQGWKFAFGVFVRESKAVATDNRAMLSRSMLSANFQCDDSEDPSRSMLFGYILSLSASH